MKLHLNIEKKETQQRNLKDGCISTVKHKGKLTSTTVSFLCFHKSDRNDSRIIGTVEPFFVVAFLLLKTSSYLYRLCVFFFAKRKKKSTENKCHRIHSVCVVPIVSTSCSLKYFIQKENNYFRVSVKLHSPIRLNFIIFIINRSRYNFFISKRHIPFDDEQHF